MITYFEPFAAAWARAQRMLFQSFHLEAWLGLGFVAFLANLGRGFGGGGGGGDMGSKIRGGNGPQVIGDDIARRVHDFAMLPWVAAAFGILVFSVIVLLLVVTWLNSRGQMMFADDVARERSAVVEPWRRTAALGNSLFFLNLLLSLVGLGAVVGLLAWPFADMVVGMWREGTFRAPSLVSVLPALLLLGPLLIAGAVVSALTHNFVIPVMLRHDLNAFAAWGRFAPLLGANLLHFVAALLLLLVAHIAFAMLVMVFGILTCCIGWVVLAIPYVGDVILLPAHTTFRGFGIEFLAQFGPEWDLRAPAPSAAEPRA